MIGRLLKRLAGAGGGLALPAAGLVAAAVPQPALASDWGCQVVLCLATPGSPTQYAECVPPITKLWNVLATGGSFPTCTGVGVRTAKIKHGYALSITRPDGVGAQYTVDTRSQTITHDDLRCSRHRLPRAAMRSGDRDGSGRAARCDREWWEYLAD